MSNLYLFLITASLFSGTAFADSVTVTGSGWYRGESSESEACRLAQGGAYSSAVSACVSLEGSPGSCTYSDSPYQELDGSFSCNSLCTMTCFDPRPPRD